MRSPSHPFEGWLAALEARHLADLTFAELRRALQALSLLYVERRGRLADGAAFDGAGKRAAFALYYAPLHFLTVRALVRALGADVPRRIVDLGCGTGAAGAAWALESPRALPFLLGIDRSDWAVREARWTYGALGLPGEAKRGEIGRVPLGSRPASASPESTRVVDAEGGNAGGSGVLLAYTVNELAPETRRRLLARLVDAASGGARVLVVEPIALAALPWWREWEGAFLAAGGRADVWRFPAELPELLGRLDRAAGLDHRELTARSLWCAAPRRAALEREPGSG